MFTYELSRCIISGDLYPYRYDLVVHSFHSLLIYLHCELENRQCDS